MDDALCRRERGRRAILAPAVELLRKEGVVVDVIDEGTSPQQAAHLAAQSPIVITGMMPFSAAAIDTLIDSRLIIRAGVGYDMIDVESATLAGVLVANVPDFCADEVADHTLALLLAAMRRLPQAMTTWRQQHAWHVTSQLPTFHRLRGKRLGLFGLGRIGRANDSLIVTSHLAWYSAQAKHELAINTAREALRFLAGEPVRNPVNPQVLAGGIVTP